MSEYYNLPCFDITNLTNAKVKHFVSVMQQKYILYRQHTMQNSSKLEFFNTFKNDCTPSYYLGLTRKLNERKQLVKFRIGNHKLPRKFGNLGSRKCHFQRSRGVCFPPERQSIESLCLL